MTKSEDEELLGELLALASPYRFWGPILLCTALWFIIGYVAPVRFSKDRTEAGQFGDMFGAANALFSGLAFLGVAYTLYLQNKESTRATERHYEQLQQQQAALEKADEAHKEQLDLAAKAASIQALSTLADLHFQMMMARPKENSVWLDKADEFADRAAFLMAQLDSEFNYSPVTFSAIKAAGTRLQDVLRSVNLNISGRSDEAVDSREPGQAIRGIQLSFGRWLVDYQALLPSLLERDAKQLLSEIQTYAAELATIVPRPDSNSSDEEMEDWNRAWHMPEVIRTGIMRLAQGIYGYHFNVQRPAKEPGAAVIHGPSHI